MPPVLALPNLTLNITAPGGSPQAYTRYLAYDGANQEPTITQNFGRQGDTALLPLVEDYSSTGSPRVVIQEMSQVSLYDNTAHESLFSGVVNNASLSALSALSNEWDCNAVDYTLYADNAIVSGIWYGYTVDQILVEITAKGACGITAVPSSQGGYVEPGPQIAAFVFNYGKLSDAWKQLATLASSTTPYGWYVDQNLELHFYDATSAAGSGVTFTTSPTAAGAGSLSEGHIVLDTTNAYAYNATQLSNRILVQGASQTVSGGSPTTSAPTDVWLATGVQTAWPLRYTVSGTPTLYAGGVQQTVTVATSGTSASGEWVVEQNSVGSYFLVADDPPSNGTEIKIWYTYQVPIIAQASDPASIAKYVGPNGGIFALFVSDSSLTTMPMALGSAFQHRTEYAFAAETFTFTTGPEFFGWVRAGWTCTIVNAKAYDFEANRWGLSDTFIVTGNQITFIKDGGYRTMQVTAVRV